MNYLEYIEWLNMRAASNSEFTTENILKLLNLFDNPQDKFKVIHISGTNGKGSVSKFIQNTLTNSFVKTGLFTSPYVDDFRESVQIDGIYISTEEYKNIMDEIYRSVMELDKLGFFVTGFEILVVLAILYFYRNNVDIAIVEVGMGGLNDATNVFKEPLATVITSISMDHQEFLGSSLSEIAHEKAGIIKERRPVFIYPQEDEVLEVIQSVAYDNNSKIYDFSFDEIYDIKRNTLFSSFSFRGYRGMILRLIGKHQIYNCALSLMVIEYLKDFFDISDAKIYDSIRSTKNIGRIELLDGIPRIILDGSHNSDSISSLIETLDLFEYDKLIVGFSMLSDKDIKDAIRRLFPLADTVVLTSINSDRSTDMESMYRIGKKYCDDLHMISNNSTAVKKTISLAGAKDLILWCGSLYLIKDIRAILKDEGYLY